MESERIWNPTTPLFPIPGRIPAHMADEISLDFTLASPIEIRMCGVRVIDLVRPDVLQPCEICVYAQLTG